MDLFGTLSLDCLKLGIPRYLAYILISSFVPVAFLAMIWLVYFLRGRRDLTVPIYWSLFVTYIFAPTVAQTQLRGLDCLTLASSGLGYLRVDTSMLCDLKNPDYQLLLGLDLPLIALYQGIPLMYFVLLYRNRHRLNPALYGRDFKVLPPDEEKNLAHSKRAKDPVLKPLSFLFSVSNTRARAHTPILDRAPRGPRQVSVRAESPRGIAPAARHAQQQ